MPFSNNLLPFENRYKQHRILNYGKPYTNYRSYNIKYNSENKTNILAIYVDNQVCNNNSTNKLITNTNTNTNINININDEKQPLLGKYIKNDKNDKNNKNNNINNINNEKQQLLNKLKEPNTSDDTKIEYKYFVEIHYTLEENKPKLEYIMTQSDINELLSKYGYVMEENDE
jgi:hypothetical protein